MLSKQQDTRPSEPLIETLLARSAVDDTTLSDRLTPPAARSAPVDSADLVDSSDSSDSSDSANSANSANSASSTAEHQLNAFSGYRGRRLKAALLLAAIWGLTVALHLVDWGIGVGAIGAIVLGIHGWRTIAVPESESSALRSSGRSSSNSVADPAVTAVEVAAGTRPALSEADGGDRTWPSVALLVAAKDEETVVGETVAKLCELDYPSDRYEVWAIDDNSSDNTGAVLDRLAQQYDRLHVIHRGADASGGKSGALNLALQQIRTDSIGVFDADARVDRDFLRRVLPLFDRPEIGAVQVRKAVVNAATNGWTRGQAIEMVLDAYLQEQRYALGGIGELRGNGQFVRRDALQRCGDFNEVTITDDLDLSLRLHLDGWDVRCTTWPCVYEEGVTGPVALWHQRSRWAEGGYQRYIDYWRLLTSGRLSPMKRFDMIVFISAQYLLPTAAIPDAIGAIVFGNLPVWLPITLMSAVLTLAWIRCGLRRVATRTGQPIGRAATIAKGIRGTIYMLHWIVVMAATTTRMAFRPKRLKWVKTIHRGE